MIDDALYILNVIWPVLGAMAAVLGLAWLSIRSGKDSSGDQPSRK